VVQEMVQEQEQTEAQEQGAKDFKQLVLLTEHHFPKEMTEG